LASILPDRENGTEKTKKNGRIKGEKKLKEEVLWRKQEIWANAYETRDSISL